MTDPTPPASPRPSQSLATIHEAQVISDASEKVIEKRILSSDVKWFAGSVVAAIAICFAVYFRLDANAQTKIDGGTAPLKTAQSELKQELIAQNARLTVVEHSTIRSEVMIEMLVRQAGLPIPPKVALDGGAR